jgi:hypothetical protein
VIGEIREPTRQRLGKFRGLVSEAPSHGDGSVENELAHRRLSLMSSLMVRPPSVTPLRNSRMRAAAACVRQVEHPLRKMNRFLEQCRRISLDSAAMRGRLVGELRLQLRRDLQRDGHVRPPCF